MALFIACSVGFLSGCFSADFVDDSEATGTTAATDTTDTGIAETDPNSTMTVGSTTEGSSGAASEPPHETTSGETTADETTTGILETSEESTTGSTTGSCEAVFGGGHFGDACFG